MTPPTNQFNYLVNYDAYDQFNAKTKNFSTNRCVGGVITLPYSLSV